MLFVVFMLLILDLSFDIWVVIWIFSEIIYSCLYIYIMWNFYIDLLKVFDEIVLDEVIMKCVEFIGWYYDDVLVKNCEWENVKDMVEYYKE